MNRYTTTAISVIAAMSVCLITAATSFAAFPTAKSKVTAETLKLQITTASGIVLGVVTNSYNHKTCSKATCTYTIPTGTSVTLTETPRDPGNWPLQQWTLNGYKWGMATTARFKMPAYAIVARVVYARHSGNAELVGTWLGPGIGDTGGCGTEYGQFTFFQNQEYSYTSNSDSCGGFTMAGSYRLQDGLIDLHWTECSYPCAAGTVTAGFEFRGPKAFQLDDQGRTYVYYRQ